VTRHRAAVERLTAIVGDPEDVVDRNGHLPAIGATPRSTATGNAHHPRSAGPAPKLPELDAQIKATDDRQSGSKLPASGTS